MVHVIFDPSSVRLSQYGGEFYVGKLYQRGRGRYGAGVGDIFRNLWRYLKPLAKSAVKLVGQEGAEAGARILSNIAQGANLKETFETEGKQGVKKILDAASRRLQEGQGLTRKRKQRRQRTSVILKPEDFIGKSLSKTRIDRKQKRKDTLGFY